MDLPIEPLTLESAEDVLAGLGFDHRWRWRTCLSPVTHERAEHPLSERVGHRCRVVVRGRMNSVLVEFPDGRRVVTSRYAVRRAR